MNEVVVEVEKTKRGWEDAYEKTIEHIKTILECGKSKRGDREENISLQMLNELAKDGLSLLNSLQFKLGHLAQQLLSDDQVQSTGLLLETWKNEYHSLGINLRSANLQARDNIRKEAQEEDQLAFMRSPSLING